ncbi:MAG: transposase [Tissierellia bacterium]|nr:transposase [Tissierellia bacterium]
MKSKEDRDDKQKKFNEAIVKIFNDSHRTYGPDRVCGLLRKQGHSAS